MIPNFPKLECPFVRKSYKVDIEDFKKYGRELQLREPKVYLVTPEVNPGYEWVFDDPDTFAVEKLNGTNIQLVTEKGRLVHAQNRLNELDLLQIVKGKAFIVEGIFMAVQKGYIKEDGEQAGEVIGPKLQGNPYNMSSHLFYPFEKAIKDLKYRSFEEHARTFDNWSSWFKDYLISRYHTKIKQPEDSKVFAEGVVFYNMRRKAERRTYMAKLRRDMFRWFYDSKVVIVEDKKSGELWTE